MRRVARAIAWLGICGMASLIDGRPAPAHPPAPLPRFTEGWPDLVPGAYRTPSGTRFVIYMGWAPAGMENPLQAQEWFEKQAQGQVGDKVLTRPMCGGRYLRIPERRALVIGCYDLNTGRTRSVAVGRLRGSVLVAESEGPGTRPSLHEVQDGQFVRIPVWPYEHEGKTHMLNIVVEDPADGQMRSNVEAWQPSECIFGIW